MSVHSEILFCTNPPDEVPKFTLRKHPNLTCLLLSIDMGGGSFTIDAEPATMREWLEALLANPLLAKDLSPSGAQEVAGG